MQARQRKENGIESSKEMFRLVSEYELLRIELLGPSILPGKNRYEVHIGCTSPTSYIVHKENFLQAEVDAHQTIERMNNNYTSSREHKRRNKIPWS